MESAAAAMSREPSVEPWRVLLVGQREEDFFLIREILESNKSAIMAELDHAHSIDEAKVLLSRNAYRLVLFENETPDPEAARLMAKALQDGMALPFVLLTEHADERSVAEIISAGAADCLPKSELSGANLMRTIRCALAVQSMQDTRKSAQESLRKLSRAVEQSADTVFITDCNGTIEYVNPAFELLTGYVAADVVGKTPRVVKSGEQSLETYQELWKTILSGNVFRSIIVNRKKTGELYYVEESISPVRDVSGKITHFISNGRDLTDRLRLEAQLLQSQKMDAIGRLAGGVAHDFNNLLTIITSYSELALDAVPPGSPTECKIQEILSAARRAAQLTRQLLAFSRKQVQALRVVEFNPVIAEIAKTLQRLIGEDIQLAFIPGPHLGRVRVDPIQIEQILLNLGANARDAMPQGGRLTIETSAVELGEKYIQEKPAVIPAGSYVLLTVTDTGTGIPRDHLPHIFEPFYTTKPSGQGTGLGLATVYGIVKQNNGFIWAYSELGMGTVFKIYLPCVSEKGRTLTLPVEKAAEPVAHSSETLLLVEDEDAVRRATGEFLRMHGYSVLEACDGIEALSVLKNMGSQIHLVVSDVVMPRMSGGQLAKEFQTLSPGTKFLFVSGYPGKTVINHKVLDFETNFLQKPFSLKQLAGKVREILDHQNADCQSTR